MKKTNNFSPILSCATFPGADTNQAAAESYDLTAVGAFTDGVEGPAVDAHGNVYAVNFSKQGTIGIINTDGDAKVFIGLPNGSIGNGIRFGENGDMFIADYTNHNVLRVDMNNRDIHVHAHDPEMNQPNDITISRKGVIYASDPNWANDTGQLWMLGKDRKFCCLEKNMGTSNGIEVSNDEQTLYVGESAQRRIWAYDILPDGYVGNKRLFHVFSDHSLDGMRTDINGNLFVARYGAGTVAILSAQGKLVRDVKLTGRFPTNLAFGGEDGKTVYVTMQKRGAIECFRADFPGREFQLKFDTK
ncbi:MAG: SMP-30/gluconolactonase/LRE family protein [Arenicella sp.]|nr:SMP-30/gluconolactonase/LRE family protein [Arenicella sp.]